MTYFSYSKVQKDNMGHFPCLHNLSNWSKPILQYRGKLILQKKKIYLDNERVGRSSRIDHLIKCNSEMGLRWYNLYHWSLIIVLNLLIMHLLKRYVFVRSQPVI